MLQFNEIVQHTEKGKGQLRESNPTLSGRVGFEVLVIE